MKKKNSIRETGFSNKVFSYANFLRFLVYTYMCVCVCVCVCVCIYIYIYILKRTRSLEDAFYSYFVHFHIVGIISCFPEMYIYLYLCIFWGIGVCVYICVSCVVIDLPFIYCF